MDLNKIQSEYYPMEIYRLICNYQDNEIIKFESPDFIIWKKNGIKIGFEVTISSNEEQNELKNIANSENREKLGKKFGFEKHKKAGKIYGNGVVIQSSESEVIHKIILNSIERKFNKLNKNFTIFNKNVLCCTTISAFLNNDTDHNYIIESLNKIKSKYNILFDEVVIITYDKVVRYTLNEDKVYYLKRDVILSIEQIEKAIDLIPNE